MRKSPPIPIGTKFGRWTIIGPLTSGRLVKLPCRCDCGTERNVERGHLLNGSSSGCECKRKKSFTNSAHRDTVGGKIPPEYSTWLNMKARCQNPKNDHFLEYGGRGISVCNAWSSDFSAFLMYIGRRPSANHSLDRYPDMNGNYEPGNVRWATASEQQRNKRNNRLITAGGRTECITKWAELLGSQPQTIRQRIRLWGDEQRAVLQPIDVRCRSAVKPVFELAAEASQLTCQS